jgi:hypothetical protein
LGEEDIAAEGMEEGWAEVDGEVGEDLEEGEGDLGGSEGGVLEAEERRGVGERAVRDGSETGRVG